MAPSNDPAGDATVSDNDDDDDLMGEDPEEECGEDDPVVNPEPTKAYRFAQKNIYLSA